MIYKGQTDNYILSCNTLIATLSLIVRIQVLHATHRLVMLYHFVKCWSNLFEWFITETLFVITDRWPDDEVLNMPPFEGRRKQSIHMHDTFLAGSAILCITNIADAIG